MLRGSLSPSGVVVAPVPHHPLSSGDGTFQNPHARLPVFTSYASTKPRISNSPPAAPTMTLPPATSGAMVNEYPDAPSAARACQTCLPVLALSAMTRASSVATNTSPLATATPRLLGPQQTRTVPLSLTFHRQRSSPVAASTAKTWGPG